MIFGMISLQLNVCFPFSFDDLGALIGPPWYDLFFDFYFALFLVLSRCRFLIMSQQILYFLHLRCYYRLYKCLLNKAFVLKATSLLGLTSIAAVAKIR